MLRSSLLLGIEGEGREEKSGKELVDPNRVLTGDKLTVLLCCDLVYHGLWHFPSHTQAVKLS